MFSDKDTSAVVRPWYRKSG